jgi:DnaJ-class molecular chaperone
MGSEERDELDAAEDDLAADEGQMLCPICEGSGVTESGDCENCGGTGYVPEEIEQDPPDL